MQEKIFQLNAPIFDAEKIDISLLNSEKTKDAMRKANEQYLHWEELKYKDWVPGNTIKDKETFWQSLKLGRFFNSKVTPVRDKTGKFFRMTTSGYVEFLHIIDKEMGGNFMGIPPIHDGDKKQYITRNIIEESIASSRLEGANTSRVVAKKMLLEGRPPRNHGERMIANSHKTMQAIEQKYYKENLSWDLLCELHSMITKDTIAEKAQGKLRETFDEKGNRLVVKPWDESTVAYVTPDKDFVERELPRLIEYANDKEKKEDFTHPLVKAIILHFWIGLLHPFEDGNGRLARILFYWYMLKNDYWAFAYLSLSEKILKSSTQYAMAYVYSEQDDCDLTYFIDYNIRKLQLARNDFQKYIKEKLGESRQLLSQARLQHEFNDRQIQLLQYLNRNAKSNTSLATHQTIYSIGKVTASTDLGKLFRLGFLHKQRVGQKVYYYPTNKVAELLKQ